MNSTHEVGRASYEAYCACNKTAPHPSSWMSLTHGDKEVWRQVEIAGLKASALALALSNGQEQHAVDQVRIHDLEQALVGSITG